MKLEAFFEQFDQFADAPDAVTKMRELVLESAIRGMLVPHNVSDEPASELLNRMTSAQAGHGRKQAPLPPVGDDAYLQVPTGWEWIRLGDTGRIFNGDSVSESGKTELAKVDGGLPFIATKDVGYGRAALDYDNGLKVPLGDPRFKVAAANAVLICAEGGSAGRKIGITDRDICFGNKLFANEVHEGIHHRYVFYVYQAPTFFREFAARMTGIIGGISRSAFVSLPIPLPPANEQKRIVAKVDELMALCDRLEAQQQERETQHAALARASLARFADAPTLANLHFLFHPSYAIPPADLRKSILTLAVRGRLVPQDPNDEPVKDALARNDERRRETSRSDHRADEENQPLLSADDRWDIADTWSWRGLADLVLFVDYRGKTPAKLSSGVRLLTAKNVRKGQITLAPEEFLSESEYQAWMTRGFPKAGDVLFTTEAPMGNAAVVELTERFALAQRVICFQSYGALDPAFLVLQILSDQFQFILDKNGTGVTAKGIKASRLKQLPIAIPPLAEQRRIVAKVEQLMALVDELEARLSAARATGADLMEAVVAELTAEA